LPLFNLVAKKLFLGRKNIGVTFAAPVRPPPPSYVYASIDLLQLNFTGKKCTAQCCCFFSAALSASP